MVRLRSPVAHCGVDYQMTDALKKSTTPVNPYLPAPADYYYDCAEARGSSALAKEFQRRLTLADNYVYFLFSGHIGCGKSSELLQLERMLTHAEPPHSCYFPVFVDASDYLDDYDTTPTDILLAIVTELADTLREKAGVELKDRYFTKRLDEVKEFILIDVEINEGELSLGVAKAKIQR